MFKKFQFLGIITLVLITGIFIPACEEPHSHSFGNWSVKTEATCEDDGEETRTCSSCEEVESRVIAKLGHKANLSNPMPGTPAGDCITPSSGDYQCERYAACGKSVYSEGVLGPHVYTNWEEQTPATCEGTGTETAICSRVESHPRGSRIINPKGHNYSIMQETTPPNCTTPGMGTSECANSISTAPCPPRTAETSPALKHEVGFKVSIAATCLEEGRETAVCTRTNCPGFRNGQEFIYDEVVYTIDTNSIYNIKSNIFGKDIPARGHTWGPFVIFHANYYKSGLPKMNNGDIYKGYDLAYTSASSAALDTRPKCNDSGYEYSACLNNCEVPAQKREIHAPGCVYWPRTAVPSTHNLPAGYPTKESFLDDISKWTVTQANRATCTAAGIKEIKCTRADYTTSDFQIFSKVILPCATTATGTIEPIKGGHQFWGGTTPFISTGQSPKACINISTANNPDFNPKIHAPCSGEYVKPGMQGPNGGILAAAATTANERFKVLTDTGVPDSAATNLRFYIEVAPPSYNIILKSWATQPYFNYSTAVDNLLGVKDIIPKDSTTSISTAPLDIKKAWYIAGRRNTNLILEGDPNAPAANEARYLEGGTEAEPWHLPSIDELELVYKNKMLLNNTRPLGKKLPESLYWSSTQDSDTNAWALDFRNGERVSLPKGNAAYVLPIRAF